MCDTFPSAQADQIDIVNKWMTLVGFNAVHEYRFSLNVDELVWSVLLVSSRSTASEHYHAAFVTLVRVGQRICFWYPLQVEPQQQLLDGGVKSLSKVLELGERDVVVAAFDFCYSGPGPVTDCRCELLLRDAQLESSSLNVLSEIQKSS